MQKKKLAGRKPISVVFQVQKTCSLRRCILFGPGWCGQGSDEVHTIDNSPESSITLHVLYQLGSVLSNQKSELILLQKPSGYPTQIHGDMTDELKYSNSNQLAITRSLHSPFFPQLRRHYIILREFFS
jgi:hypothetical protein